MAVTSFDQTVCPYCVGPYSLLWPTETGRCGTQKRNNTYGQHPDRLLDGWPTDVIVGSIPYIALYNNNNNNNDDDDDDTNDDNNGCPSGPKNMFPFQQIIDELGGDSVTPIWRQTILSTGGTGSSVIYYHCRCCIAPTAFSCNKIFISLLLFKITVIYLL